MVQVVIDPLQAVHGGSLGLLPAGSTRDLPLALAQQLVGAGDARWVSPPPQQLSAIEALVSAAGNFTVNSRDGLGRATSFTDSSGTTYTVTYGNFGPVTVSGGGQTRTYSYNAAGQMTGFAAS